MSKEKLNKKNHTSHFALHTSNKGITLIALIITIVVMLILVAVTLDIAIGENGLVNKAKTAGEATTREIDREKLLTAVVGAIGNNGTVKKTDIVLPEGFTESNGVYTSSNGYEFTVSENGEVQYKDSAEENTGTSILNGKYYCNLEKTEYYEVDVENSIISICYVEDEETISNQFIITNIDENNETIAFRMNDGEFSFEVIFRYEVIEDNGNIVNVILFDVDDCVAGWKNTEGGETILDGVYLNENGNYRIVFEEDQATVEQQYFDGEKWGYSRGFEPTFYKVYNGIIYIDEWSVYELSEDLTTISDEYSTYTKQPTE